MSTTSRWPWATRRRISASTASALAAARGAAHERDHAEVAREASSRPAPSRTRGRGRAGRRPGRSRSRRRRPRSQPASPRSAWRSRRRSRAGRRTRRRRGSRRSRSRRRAGGCGPPARRRGATSASASWVTQHVFRTATSPPGRSACPSREQALAHRLRVGVRDLAAEEIDRERRHRRGPYLRPYVQVGRPAVGLAPLHAAVAGEVGRLADEVAGGDDTLGTRAGARSHDRPRGRRSTTAVSAAGSGSTGRRRARASTFDSVRRRVCDRRLDRLRVVVEREHGVEADLRRCDREDAGAAADVEQAPARARAAARGRGASSRATRCRTRGRGRSRPRSRRRRAPPTAGRPRAGRSAPAGGTRASGPPSLPRHRTTARRRKPTRAAPRPPASV